MSLIAVTLHGVAVDWIFSSRIQFVGLEPILGDILVVGRGLAFLEILKVNGRVSGRTRCLHENTFMSKKNYKKNFTNARQRQTTQYPIQWNEKN